MYAGCDATRPDNSGLAPVHCCALHGTEAVFRCFSSSTWTLPNSGSGRCALHFAAMSGNLGVVECITEQLREEGTEVLDLQDDFGQSALVVAVIYFQPHVAQLVKNLGRT